MRWTNTISVICEDNKPDKWICENCSEVFDTAEDAIQCNILECCTEW